MPRSYIRLASLLAVLALAAHAAAPVDSHLKTSQMQLRPHFEPVANPRGGYRFLSRGNGYGLLLADDHAELILAPGKAGAATIRMKWTGDGSAAKPVAEGLLSSHSNYIRGDDSDQWRINVPHYQSVRYREVWPGIDLVFHGDRRALEYDFVVLPGADPNEVAFAIDGASNREIDEEGNLQLAVSGRKIHLQPPLVYQDTPEGHKEVEGRYRLLDGGEVSFTVSGYDRNLPLVIDPLISFSTYLGGAGSDYAYDVAVDSTGNIYVAGTTYSAELPAVAGAYDSSLSSSPDFFVSKLTPDGSSVVFSTYLGGNGSEYGPRLGLDTNGNIVIAGGTASSDFPTTDGTYLTDKPSGTTVFVTKLLADGSGLVYSTYIGAGTLTDMAVDGAGDVHVLARASSTGFPTTSGAFQETFQGGSYDLAVCLLTNEGTELAYSTYLGGTGTDYGQAIAVDGAYQTVVVGYTYSTDYPTTAGSLQPALTNTSYSDGIVTKLSPDGDSLIYSTYLGGSDYDYLYDVATDPLGSVYVVGRTSSSDFPTTIGAYRAVRPDYDSTIISVLNAAGSSLEYSTYCWSTKDEQHIARNAWGEIHIGGRIYGYTWSGLPATPYAFQSSPGGSYYDTYVAKFSADLSVLLYASYLGGSDYDYLAALAVDEADNLYAVGYTESSNFPTTPGALQPAPLSSLNAFVTKIAPSTIPCTYTLAPDGFELDFTEQTIELDITTPAGCVWMLQGSTSWLLADETSGVGPATVTFAVSENHNVQDRSMTLTVADQSISAVQAGEPCTYTLIPQSRSFGIAGGTSTVSVVTPSGCYWKPSSAASWISFSSGNYRSGDGVLEFSVAANGGLPRGASIVIANSALTVFQSGSGSAGSPPAAPTYTSPANGATNVVETPILSWQSVAGATSYSVYVGRDDVGHLELVASNVTGTSAPAGSLTGNRPYFWKVIAQNAYGDSAATSPTWSFVTTSCSTTLTLGKTGFSQAGGTGSISVAAAGCPWNAYSDADWLTITSGATGVGNGTVQFSAPPYDGLTARVAALMVGGRELVVAQAGEKDPIITTYAGSGTSGCCFDGSPATQARLNAPRDAAVDAQGNVYIADTSNNRIRKVSATTGTISTFAGTGTSGFSGDGGAATAAKLSSPAGVAVDTAGNVYIADSSNNRIRKVNASNGIITTVAGNGSTGYSGDGGQATAASLFYPRGLAFDGNGNLLIADASHHAVRRVSAATGVITAVAGTGSSGYYGDGGPATAARLYYPYGVAVDPQGNILIADHSNLRVRRVDAGTGYITTVAGTGNYYSNGDGGPATAAAIYYPNDVVVDQAGNVYISDSSGHSVRKVDALTGIISSAVGTGEYEYSGDGGPAAYASLREPGGLAYDPIRKDLFIVDFSTPVVRKVAGIGEEPGPPPAPSYVYPENSAVDVPMVVTFRWNAAPGATSYDLYVGLDSIAQLSLYTPNITGTSYESGVLTQRHTVYWKVVAKNAVGSSAATSPVWSFTVLSCNSYAIGWSWVRFAAAGGSDSASVGAESGCAWVTQSGASWVTVTSGPFGIGNGSVSISVAENTGRTKRETWLKVAGATLPVIQAGARPQPGQVGVSANGLWCLDDGSRTWDRTSDPNFQYGPINSGWTPLIGDWDGDGVSTPGLYVPSSGIWLLKNTAGPGNADIVFQYGPGGLGWVPLVGDWDGDGVDTPGLYAPDSGVWFLKNSLGPGNADEMFGYGPAGLGWLPVIGDWDGNGTDTPGLYAPDTSFWFLKNSLGPGAADAMFGYGPGGAGWLPVAGDWDADGIDTIGLYSPDISSNIHYKSFWWLRDELAGGQADSVFAFTRPPTGPTGSSVPLVGTW